MIWRYPYFRKPPYTVYVYINIWINMYINVNVMFTIQSLHSFSASVWGLRLLSVDLRLNCVISWMILGSCLGEG